MISNIIQKNTKCLFDNRFLSIRKLKLSKKTWVLHISLHEFLILVDSPLRYWNCIYFLSLQTSFYYGRSLKKQRRLLEVTYYMCLPYGFLREGISVKFPRHPWNMWEDLNISLIYRRIYLRRWLKKKIPYNQFSLRNPILWDEK